MRVLDLFSGIGGFSLGLERAGMQTIGFCEIDPYCRQVLAQHWPGVPIHEDIKDLTPDGGSADLICGGFPCQPWSQAGERRGAEDDRDLWPEMLRVIKAVEPRWIIGENVRGFVNQPLGLQRSVSDLETCGYSVQSFLIPACGVGALHRRERIWIIAKKADAHTDSQRSHREKKHKHREGESADRQERHIKSVRKVLAGSGDTEERSAGAVGHANNGNDGRLLEEREQQGGGGRKSGTLRQRIVEASGSIPTNYSEQGERQVSEFRKRCGEISMADAQEQTVPDSHGSRKASGGNDRGMGGKREPAENTGDNDPCWWLPEPDVGRVAHGIPRRVDRLKALGNSIVPQIAEAIGRAIIVGEYG